MKRHPKRILTILITLLLAGSILPKPILEAGDHARIISVSDGDTIVVNYKGNNEKVRFLCVDTPESIHPDRKQNIPMGKIASDYTEKRLTGKYVDLEFEGPFRGRYRRKNFA
jgi:micrococcal nuclease